MPEIQHQVGINAPIETVHAHFATLVGLADFWTTTVEGDPSPGGTLRFYFGGERAAAVMEVVEVSPTRVLWRCTEGPDEWVGTEFTFNLTASENETIVYFTNTGWREAKEFMGHCTTKWGYYFLGLKRLLEGGTSVAYPNDFKIISWEEERRSERMLQQSTSP